MTRTFGILLGLVAALTATAATATDTWTKPFDGVKRLRRVTSNPNEVVSAVVVALDTPGVHFQSTSTSQRKKTTSSFAKLIAGQVAINGDFFSYATYATSGLAAGSGAAWKDTLDTKSAGTFAFDKGTKLELTPLAPLVTFDSSWMEGVVSGHPWLVKAGVVETFSPNSSFCQTRHPRTAIGLSEDKKTLVLAVVDGRTTKSVGMTCKELGTLLKGLGAYESMNFDGGGSSTMYVQGAGVVNAPSDGVERTVANHLALFAPKSGSVGSFAGVVYEKDHPEHPLEGATVSIETVGEDVTNEKGAYELMALPGTYTITAKELGYDSASVEKTIAAGEPLTVDFALAPAAATDFDDDGVPDVKDNCAKVSNANQSNNDADAFGDACDADDDEDGVMDEDDDCPLDAGIGEACPGSTASGSDTTTEPSGVRGVGSEASCSVGSHGRRFAPGLMFGVAAALFFARRATVSCSRTSKGAPRAPIARLACCPHITRGNAARRRRLRPRRARPHRRELP